LVEFFVDMGLGWYAIHCGKRLIDGLEAELPIANANTHGSATKDRSKGLLGLDKRSRPTLG
jgi:hypothetical protein